MPAAVEGEGDLRRGDGERAASGPARLERGGDLAGGLERLRPRRLGALGAGEDAVDLRIVQARVRPDDAAVERAARQPRAREVEFGGDREPVFVRTQRAGHVGERLREHGLHGRRDVDARRAPVRLPVDRRARLDVRRDIGDVHPHPDAAFDALGGDGVVEIARRGRIDREGGQIREVAATVAVRARLARGAIHVGREPPPQAAVEHESLDHVAGDVGAADAPHDLGVAAARAGWRHEHEVADPRARVAVDGDPGAALEEGRGRQLAAAPIEDAHHRRGAGPRPVRVRGQRRRGPWRAPRRAWCPDRRRPSRPASARACRRAARGCARRG